MSKKMKNLVFNKKTGEFEEGKKRRGGCCFVIVLLLLIVAGFAAYIYLGF